MERWHHREVVVADDDVDAAPGGALDGGMVSNADVRCDDQSDAVLCRLVCGDDREAVAFDEAIGDVVVESLASTEEPQGTLEYETGCGAVHVVVRHDANALFAPNRRFDASDGRGHPGDQVRVMQMLQAGS